MSEIVDDRPQYDEMSTHFVRSEGFRDVLRGETWLRVTDTFPDFWSGYGWDEWEPHAFRFVERFCSPGKAFVDIGAWIGPLTLWAAKRMEARVVALEPDPVAYDLLTRNVEASEVGDQVCALHAAMGARSGKAKIVVGKDGFFGSSMSRVDGFEQHPVEQRIEVEMVTFDRALDRCGLELSEVGLVKMDVEGYERVLMPKLGPKLAKAGVPIYLSVHDDWTAELAWLRGYERILPMYDGVLATC